MTQLLLPPGLSVMTGFEALAPPPQPGPGTGGHGDDFGKAAPLGLVVLLLFFLAVALLVRSMNKHLRRVPKSFDNDSGTPPHKE
jgi:hypothetical protein